MVIMDDAIADWEVGLPSANDLTPLSHSLIPSELAYAFKISAETPRTMVEVDNASRITFSSLRLNPAAPNFKSFEDDHVMAESEPFEEVVGSDPKRIRGTDEETIDNCTGEKGKAVKRPRLVWTPQLHKRFVDVVTHLGLKNAVPKTIMDLMNVEGLTRENVASHLQKYRLYVKRMSDEGSSPSDHLLASRPMPPTQSFNEPFSSQGNGNFKGNHSNNNSCGNENSYSRMQMPMMELGPGNVNFSGEFHGYEDEYSLDHHHQHHHHYYEQQYGNMAQ